MKRSSRAFAFLGVSACLCSCVEEPLKPAVHPVVQLAQFDLNCARNQLSYTRINANMIGVRGCGRQTKYVRVCRTTVGLDEVCQWLQN